MALTPMPAPPSTRVVYASGVAVPDCVIRTGAKVSGGGTPTDNAAALNAVLATATEASPVHLVVDGGFAMGAPLVIPAAGHVTVSGLGWSTGFFWLSGSSCSQIQTSNVGTTQAQHLAAVHPTSPQSITGRNVTLRDFFVNCNRGTYPNGLMAPTVADGSISGYPSGTALSVDARGLLDFYFVTSILLVGLDNLRIERLSVFDSPSYHIDLYHCTHVWIDGCRVEAGTPTFSGNTDGIHFNGGCGNAFVTNCWFSTGDDAIAINVEEGDGQAGGDFLIDNCTFSNCQSVGRVHGQSVATRRVTFSNCQGDGIRAWAFQLGNGSTSGVETNHSVYLRNCDIRVTGASLGYGYSFAYLNGPAGLVELSDCHLIEPTAAIPLVLHGSAAPTISALRILDCGIHRNASGNAAATAFAAEAGGTIGELSVLDFHLTERAGVDYADAGPMVATGGLTVGRVTLSGSFEGAGTVLGIASGSAVGSVVIPHLSHGSNAGSATAYSVVAAGATVPVHVGGHVGRNLAGLASGTVTLTGPGILPSGYPVADALMGNNSPYLGSGHSNVPCVKVAGTAHTITLS